MSEMLKAEFLGDELETVMACPVCENQNGTILHSDLEDITFGNVAGQFRMKSCTECRAIYLDPRPIPDVIGRAYSRYYTHVDNTGDQDGQRSLIRRVRRMLANDYRAVRYGAKVGPRLPLGAMLLKVLPRQRMVMDTYYRYLPRTKGRVLDFGCGNGAFLTLARDVLGWDVKGLDFDPDAVAKARMAGLDVDQGGPEALDALEEQFEAITLAHVIEHVYNPRDLMAAVFARLKPGGFVFVETPNATAQSHQVFGPHWRGLEAPRHLMVPSWSAMERLLGDAGFEGLIRHPRLDTFAPMYKRSAALAEGQNSEDPASQARADPPAEMIAEIAADPDRCEYVTMTAHKPG